MLKLARHLLLDILFETTEDEGTDDAMQTTDEIVVAGGVALDDVIHRV